MSCSWHVYCLRCKDAHPLDVNHGEGVMRALVRNAERIAEVHALLGDVPWGGELILDAQRVETSWFVVHRGHELTVRNEYGRFLGHCPHDTRCPHCEHVHHCRLAENHEGPCEPPSPGRPACGKGIG